MYLTGILSCDIINGRFYKLVLMEGSVSILLG